MIFLDYTVTGISHQKYEHMVKENEMKRRELKNQHEEEMEEMQDKLHKLERQVCDRLRKCRMSAE